MYIPDLALLIAYSSSFFSLFVFCYDEAPWQPSYDYYHIDLGELGGHHGANQDGLGVKIPVPKDVMVDVINDLGIKLLAIHNERNENNIAISPYGALSVLAALSEGLQGDAVHEILQAAHIPKDKHVIRVGLRDIHRHLKSYFIPEEGFLAGLTLNLNNVTLRGEYEDVLRFYGFDYGSFNNALFPEPFTTHTTQKPSEGSTLGITLGVAEGTTIGTTQEIKDTTIILTDTRVGGSTIATTTTQETTDKEVTTPSLLTTIQEKEITTTVGKKEEATTIETSAAPTPVPPTTIQSTITSLATDTTTLRITTKVPETTIANQETTTTALLQTSETSAENTTEAVTTTTQQESTTGIFTPAKDDSETNTETPATESVSISSKISKVTAKVSESSFEYSAISTYLLETTTVMSTAEKPITTEGPTTAVQETTTPQVTTISTAAPVATTQLLTTTTEPQKTTETITTVPTTVASETTTNFPSTTTSSDTVFMTHKTGDAQRTTRQISASMTPSEQLTTVPIKEITTVLNGETTVPTEETTASDEKTTLSSQTITVPNLESPLPTKISTVLASLTPSDQLTTVPIKEIITVLIGETTVPTEETTASDEKTTLSSQTTTVPNLGSTFPTKISTVLASLTPSDQLTTVPIKEIITVLIGETTVPTEETTASDEKTTLSSQTITVPNLVSTFPTKISTVLASLTPSDQLTTVPIKEITTVLIGETTVPTEETTASDEKTTLSSQTTTVPNLGSIFPTEISTVLADTTSQTSLEETDVPFMEDTVVPLVNTEAPFERSTVAQNDVADSSVGNTPMQFLDQLSDIETTTPFFFGTTPDFQDLTTFNQDNFEYNYNYDTNAPFNNSTAVDQVSPVYDDNSVNLVNNNLMVDRPDGASFNRNFRRRARSVVDYVVARYYDDHQHYPYVAAPSRTIYPNQQEHLQRPQYASQPERQQYVPQQEPQRRTQYVPQQEPLTFAVYGKYRESGINFMKYDTVLPFSFVPNLKALALSFPLDSTKYYLLLLLPVEDNGVDQLICDLRLHGNLRYIIEHLRLTHVVATIPSFMLKGYVTLTPLLQRLGIRRIFEPRQADFSPMTNVSDIYVTNIEQAVTVTIRNYLDPSAQHYKNFRQYSPVDFKADHPFLYFVIDSDLHVALMVGKVINPLNSRIR